MGWGWVACGDETGKGVEGGLVWGEMRWVGCGCGGGCRWGESDRVIRRLDFE